MREALIVPAAADVDVRQRSDSTTHSRLAPKLEAHVPVLRTTPHFSSHIYVFHTRLFVALALLAARGLIHSAFALFTKFC